MSFKGLTNQIEVSEDKVIKTSTIISEAYLDKKNEASILIEFVSLDQDIMVKPRTVEFKNDRLVSSFRILKDYQSLESLAIDEHILDLVVEGIQKMHQIKIHPLIIKKFDFVNFLEFFVNNVKNHSFYLSEKIEVVKEYGAHLQNAEFVVSHNDMVPGNILIHQNNDIKFIDYDYVKLNNPLFDIASFITETLNDNTDMIKSFVKKAIEKQIMKQSDIDDLNKCIAYQDVLWTLWANYMYEKTNEEIYLQIGQEKYERTKNRIKI
ncbi:choline kinase [Spiroplasma helicoides]|uniref:Choline kinase n=1 Tax=Spiroplasma helicoides TaxID=216938 RepID=A0A1B3SK77_9MOLU|nr:phosphotransferase [Spiroplasma helicoides]AOG60331.1 choline kinase [Spiroplasma helicoides]